MKIFPFERIELITELTFQEVTDFLNNNVDTTPYFNTSYSKRSTCKYIGRVDQGKFLIHRVIKGRNSFLPTLSGKIEATTTGSKIILILRLNQLVIGFIVAFICLQIYFLARTRDYSAIFFMVFLYLLTMFSFNRECNIAKKDLAEILHAAS